MKHSLLLWRRAVLPVLFFSLLSVAGMSKGYAYDLSIVCSTGQTLYYNITDEENHYVELTCPGTANSINCWLGFTKPTGNISIPETIQYDSITYSLTSIGNYAFYGCYGMTGNLSFPNSVTSIGNYAFYGCSGLTSIIIPNSVIYIGNFVFSRCSGLTSITIPNSVTSISNSAFEYCNGLTSIVIPNSVTSIGDNAFYYCINLTSISIPNSVTYIGDIALYGCRSLTSIVIPNSVTSIGCSLVGNCSGLEQIIVASGNTFYDSRENCNAIIKTSTNQLIAGCKNTIIPNSVTSIGMQAFYYCTNLTSIEIPNSVTSIGIQAFYNCNSLTSIVIPNFVTSIGYHAFSRCNGLTLLVVLANNPPALSNNSVFDYVDKAIPVYVPCGNVEAYTTTNWGGFSNFVELCEGEITVTANPVEGGTVTGGGFYGNGMAFTLTATANPGYTFINWTKDGVGVFNSATYQFYVAGDASYVANFAPGTTITFADANVKNLCVANWDTDGDGKLSYAEAAMVTDLGTVFINKSNITSFNELQYFVGLKSIRSSAFHYCSNMTSIVIPTSVTSIGNSAFRGCGSMTSIVIPNSVKSIGNDAFCYCNGLTSIIVLADTPPSLSSSSFYNVNKGIPVYVPCGCVEAYQSVPYWNQFTNIQENCTQQTITLSEGWNWFSTYIEITNPIEMLQMLEEALGENGLQIKNDNISTEYDSEWGWFGDLDEVGFTNEEMIMIKTAADCTFELQGLPANPASHPITINPGWNWIGYPCAEEMTLVEAFSNFAPEQGDKIKNSEGSSEYDSEWGWFGDMETLVPGQGFMYYSASTVPKTLVFQAGRKK